MMRRVLLLLAVASTFVVVRPGPAAACSCASISEAAAERRSNVVFAGTLEEVRAPLFSLGDQTLTYLFEVDTVVKGRVSERVVMKNFRPSARTRARG